MEYGRKVPVVNCLQHRGTPCNCPREDRALGPGGGSPSLLLRGLARPNAGSDRKNYPWKDRASPDWNFGGGNRLIDLEVVTRHWTNVNGVGSKKEIGKSIEGRRGEDAGRWVR
jgi:hypothetical protein